MMPPAWCAPKHWSWSTSGQHPYKPDIAQKETRRRFCRHHDNFPHHHPPHPGASVHSLLNQHAPEQEHEGKQHYIANRNSCQSLSNPIRLLTVVEMHLTNEIGVSLWMISKYNY